MKGAMNAIVYAQDEFIGEFHTVGNEFRSNGARYANCSWLI